MAKVINATWFTQMNNPNTIGIVITEDAQGKPRAYIGTGLGRNEADDAQLIARTGAKFNVEVAKQLFS